MLYRNARLTLTVAPASSTAAIAAIGQIACNATAAGMFSTGEAKPDSTIAGEAKTKTPRIACCWVRAKEEIASHTPTAASM